MVKSQGESKISVIDAIVWSCNAGKEGHNHENINNNHDNVQNNDDNGEYSVHKKKSSVSLQSSIEPEEQNNPVKKR